MKNLINRYKSFPSNGLAVIKLSKLHFFPHSDSRRNSIFVAKNKTKQNKTKKQKQIKKSKNKQTNKKKKHFPEVGINFPQEKNNY